MWLSLWSLGEGEPVSHTPPELPLDLSALVNPPLTVGTSHTRQLHAPLGFLS